MNLLEYKSKNKFTYQQLSKLLGFPGATIHHWIQANVFPSKGSIKKIVARTQGDVTEEDLRKFFDDCGKKTRIYEELCPYCKQKWHRGNISQD